MATATHPVLPAELVDDYGQDSYIDCPELTHSTIVVQTFEEASDLLDVLERRGIRGAELVIGDCGELKIEWGV